MKKLLIFFLLLYKSVLLGQTVLNSYPLDLKKYDQANQVLNVENTITNDVFVFATNTENVTVLKYNSALFLKSELTVARANLEGYSIIGYSFSEDENPTLYWATEDYKSIIVAKYYLEDKTYKMLSFKFPALSQSVITTFQKNNLFYILTKDKVQPILIAYIFKNGVVEEKAFDFAGFTFQNRKTQFLTFNDIIKENPIEKIESDDYNPLYKSAQRSKVYMLDNHIVLSLDYNPKKTQVFDMNLENHDLIEKNFDQSETQSPRKSSNSFLYQDKIYQINATQDELIFDVKNYNSGEILKSFKVTKNDTIRFKSSPLLMQGETERTREIKKTSKFLQRLSYLDIGLSVFKSGQTTMVTLGGVPRPERMYYTVNDELFSFDYTQTFHSESVFFESTLDRNNEFFKRIQQPLALDNINYFLNQNKKATFPNILKFRDFYILGYFDSGTKQYIMRKFTDGFAPEEPLNPIINKAIFSKSFPVDKP
ncbi:hypothetical protein BC749_101387 [Flavobacterium araucananum]|uniref:Uncharacterized protein n=1 Tax=Flavobacterium araucananum TaxID=946678 RepID=A0A227P6F7_9FLAO|nr:hypothetical protein [Flavobacterium araucananum]OXG05530.1 hypothetical protein B0A64_12535 [Flavobacterium araucananum]PWK02322.1 hypothetical protein BC749_101387 [Flavobacterium araucananum]